MSKSFSMASVLTLYGIMMLVSASYARQGHSFKELILHERLVPFDDSLPGDHRNNVNSPVNDDNLVTGTVTVPGSVYHSELTPSPGSQPDELLSRHAHDSLSTVKDFREGIKTTRKFHKDKILVEVQETKNLLENETKVLERKLVQGQGQGQDQDKGPSIHFVTPTADNGGTKPFSTSLEGHDTVPKFSDPCRYVYCRVGRVCVPSQNGRGQCVCAGPDHCKGRARTVCGSNGQVYPSHCELHRAACLRSVHITMDRTGERCRGHLSNDSIATLSTPREEGLGDGTEKTPKQYPTSYTSSTQCTESELNAMLSSLIANHCAKLKTNGMNLSCTNVRDRHFVASSMFSVYDHNGDSYLDALELEDAGTKEPSKKLSIRCSLTDLLKSKTNSEKDLGQVALTEFLAAFGVSLATLDKALKVYTTSVAISNSVELKCDVKGSNRIVWKRKGNSLDGTVDKRIRVFDDGSLYIGDLRLDHMGNYTCQDRMSSDVIQTHVLLVQTLPQVSVYPSKQIHLSGSTVSLRCHADGVPRPEILWEKNEWPIPTNAETRKRFLFLNNNTVLEIKSADYRSDTGAYKCKAKNSAGTSDQVAAVFVENAPTSKHSSYTKQSQLFAAFHDNGYTVFEVSGCHTEHQVTKDFHGFRVSPERRKSLDTLCPGNDSCSWSDAVLVKNKFVYVAQPNEKRVTVIELNRSNPIEVILVECFPERLNYIEQLDEVWVICLKNDPKSQSEAFKDIVIIRQASSYHPHVPSAFPRTSVESNQITGVFLPEANSLKHSFEYGYITHGNSMVLRKLHLASTMYVKEIALQKYGCIPTSVHFIPLGGLILVGCRANVSEVKPSFHILLDYITDGFLERLMVNGDCYLSPDARRVVILGDGGNTAFVFKVSDEGVLQHVFDEYTQLQLDDVAFFPSESGFGYDAFVSTADQSTILHLDLESGRVSAMEGIQDLPGDRLPKTGHHPIVQGSGPFAEHLVTSSRDSVVSIDGKRRQIVCQWREIFGVRVIIPLPDYHSA